MRRAVSAVLAILTLVVLLQPPGGATNHGQSTDSSVRMARATWDTGWFQAEVYRLLLERLGYGVEGPVTMGNPEFYDAVATGDVDLWVNGWFPAHDVFVADRESVEKVGTAVDDGALQGYFVDAVTAETHGITNLGDLADPELAALFDHDGDGRADLVGCEDGWSCALTIDHHLEAYGLTATVEHVQGQYSPLIAETIARQRAGESVLYYTWTPNWTVGVLTPGDDVVWLETPFPSLPQGAEADLEQTVTAGIPGCANDPCATGWRPNDIRAVANSDFLDANPSVRRLLEQVIIPLDDISKQNVRLVTEGGDPEDIQRHAQEWVDANLALVNEWIFTADPDAVTLTDSANDETADGGTLRVAARPVPPFVIYENGSYTGFEVELVQLLAAKLGMSVEIYAVDTVAKQIDDIDRGVAQVGLGGVAITESREELVDFTLPVLDSGLTILTPTRDSQNIGDRIVTFFDAIASSDLPWLLAVFGIAVLIAAHLVWLIERHHNPDFAVPYRRGIWDSFYWSVVTMSTVGYGDKVARRNSGRVLALIWIALGTLVFASFTAAIASSLAVSELRSDISGPSDLRGLRVATATNSAAETYLPSIGVGPVLVDNIEEAYPLILQGEVDAIVFDAPVLDFHAAREGAGEVTTLGSDFERVQYGLMLNEDDPELRERLNLALLDTIEGGVHRQLHDTWFGAEN